MNLIAELAEKMVMVKYWEIIQILNKKKKWNNRIVKCFMSFDRENLNVYMVDLVENNINYRKLL